MAARGSCAACARFRLGCFLIPDENAAACGRAYECPKIPAVDSTKRQPLEPPRDRGPATLGDVLYADTSKTPASEAEWVALVGSIAAGDQFALHALYERTYRVVFTLIVRINNNRETAEELTLDVFHDVWRRASDYNPENGTVLGWIMNQARSRAIDRLRFEQRKKRVDPYAGVSMAPEEARDSHDMLEFRQESQALQAALAGLTTDERQAIETAFFSEMTYADAAAKLNQPLGTVKTRIRSGLQKLRHALRERLEK